MNKIQLLSTLVLAMTIGVSCAEQRNESALKIEKACSEEVRLFSDTVLFVGNLNDSVEVIVDFPDSIIKGTVILLQGWGFSNTNWCDSSDLCSQLLTEGFVVVQPDMKKSIYAWQRYPQTRKDWYEMPTRQWFIDTLIPTLESIQLLIPEENNSLIGLSTGARGALLVGIDTQGLFDHVVCLSGDYDQKEFPNDNLYKGYFGTIKEHPECYQGLENPIDQLSLLKSKLLIAHGGLDKVVSVEHSRRLVDALKEAKVDYEYVEIPDAKHDYAFWGGETQRIIKFIKN